MRTTQTVDADTGRRLRALRFRAHLPMRELARQAGVAVSCVSNIEGEEPQVLQPGEFIPKLGEVAPGPTFPLDATWAHHGANKHY